MARKLKRRLRLTALFAGACFVLCVLLLASAIAADRAVRPEWNQSKAVSIVERMLEVERSGTPWDAIAWHEAEQIAVDRAVREQKPLLVFYYLRKDVGPPEAPC